MGLVVCVTAMHRVLLLAGRIRGSNILIQETLDCNTILLQYVSLQWRLHISCEGGFKWALYAKSKSTLYSSMSAQLLIIVNEYFNVRQTHTHGISKVSVSRGSLRVNLLGSC